MMAPCFRIGLRQPFRFRSRSNALVLLLYGSHRVWGIKFRTSNDVSFVKTGQAAQKRPEFGTITHEWGTTMEIRCKGYWLVAAIDTVPVAVVGC